MSFVRAGDLPQFSETRGRAPAGPFLNQTRGAIWSGEILVVIFSGTEDSSGCPRYTAFAEPNGFNTGHVGMKVLLQNKKTRFFVQESGSWTISIEEGFGFINSDKAIDFVKKLSEVYRYVLDQKDHELVDLAMELKFVESYVFLQKIRFGENLVIEVNVNPMNFKVIPLSVQMLVENAIKHNEISDRKPFQIKIYSTDDNCLIVENQLQKKAGSEGSGTGIQNIRDRYEFFSKRKLIIFENMEKFLVSIPLLTD